MSQSDHRKHRFQKREYIHLCQPSYKEIDGNKDGNGCEEHNVVDTLGFPMAVSIYEVDFHNSNGAPKVIKRLGHKFPRLVLILSDRGYHETFRDCVTRKF